MSAPECPECGHPIALLGMNELAERLGVNRSTLAVRRHRGQLPEPDTIVSGSPLWLTETIEAFENYDGPPDAVTIPH